MRTFRSLAPRRSAVLGVAALFLSTACAGENADDTRDATADVAATDTDTSVDASGAPDVGDATDTSSPDTTADTETDTDDTPTVRYVYDPFGGAVLTTLPDDALTVADPASTTGLRVAIDPTLPWYESLVGLPRDVVDGLDGLDGWGLNAAIAVVFDAPLGEVPSGLPSSLDSDGLQLWALSADAPTRVPYEVTRTEDGGLLVLPLFPLAPATQHVLVGTQALAPEGARVDPGPIMASLLRGDAEGALAPMNTRYAEALDAIGMHADNVAFAVAFTTQDALAVSRAVAADIRERTYAWDDEVTCTDEGELRRCEGSFSAWSWRDEDGHFGGADPVREYTLKVSTWLPPGEGPFRTAIFGHGLVHGRDVGGAMARQVGPMGVAVVAIDAVAHGEHPDAPEDDAMVLFEFFSLGLDPLGHDPLVLRDNFRQSTWDKLQLLRLLELDPDIDGDGDADVDLDRMIYVGESFGGIMAIELLALTDVFQAAALQLAGGRVVSIIGEARRFEVVRLLVGGQATPSEVARFFPMVQAVVDAGDAATWAPYVLQNRLPEIGGTPPHMMVQLVIDDDTVPDASGDALVRALGLDHVPPVPRAVVGTEMTGPAPVAGNRDDGTRTAGFFQFDRIRREPPDPVEVATHDFMPSSEEGEFQLQAFVQAWVDGELPPIVDPYDALETPALD